MSKQMACKESNNTSVSSQGVPFTKRLNGHEDMVHPHCLKLDCLATYQNGKDDSLETALKLTSHPIFQKQLLFTFTDFIRTKELLLILTSRIRVTRLSGRDYAQVSTYSTFVSYPSGCYQSVTIILFTRLQCQWTPDVRT